MRCICNLFYHRRLPVDFLDKKHWVSASNPSICYDKELDSFYINIRNTNYTLKKRKKDNANIYKPVGEGIWEGKGPFRGEPVYKTRNFIGVCKDPMTDDINWNQVTEEPRKQLCPWIGLEDCRISRWNGKTYLSGCRRDWNTGRIGRIELQELNKNFHEVRSMRFNGPNNDNSSCEKNHMPIDNDPFTFVVCTYPTIVCKQTLDTPYPKAIKGNTRLCSCACVGTIKGSSQVIPYNDKYIAIVHTYFGESGCFDYQHYVAVWDKDFKLIHQSEPFRFEGAPIEFCCGMAIKEEYAYITYSIMDGDASVVRISVDDLLAL